MLLAHTNILSTQRTNHSFTGVRSPLYGMRVGAHEEGYGTRSTTWMIPCVWGMERGSMHLVTITGMQSSHLRTAACLWLRHFWCTGMLCKAGSSMGLHCTGQDQSGYKGTSSSVPYLVCVIKSEKLLLPSSSTCVVSTRTATRASYTDPEQLLALHRNAFCS